MAALKSIAARLKNDTSRNTSELACHAALPALDRPEPELARAAIEVLDAGVKGFENSGQPEPLGSLLLMLARRQFQLGDAAGGRKRLEAYLEATEKNTLPLQRRLSPLSSQAAARARRRRIRPRGLGPTRSRPWAGSSTRQPIPAAIPRSTTPSCGSWASSTPSPRRSATRRSAPGPCPRRTAGSRGS